MIDLFAPDIPAEHYAAIGKVASASAQLEHVIDTLCLHVLGVEDEAGFCLTAQIMGPARKTDALIALMELRGAPESAIKRAKALKGKIVGLGEDRNRVLHDPWSQKAVPEAGYNDVFPEHLDLGPLNVPGLFAGLKVPKKYAPHRFQVTARATLVSEDKRVDTETLEALAAQITRTATALIQAVLIYDEPQSEGDAPA